MTPYGQKNMQTSTNLGGIFSFSSILHITYQIICFITIITAIATVVIQDIPKMANIIIHRLLTDARTFKYENAPILSDSTACGNLVVPCSRKHPINSRKQESMPTYGRSDNPWKFHRIMSSRFENIMFQNIMTTSLKRICQAWKR